ncbi:MAG: nucleotide exchange factor GrpE [Myxococcota bacterium]|nr:nucleotide exchange factor GrpE [Myxococcota bacterium]
MRAINLSPAEASAAEDGPDGSSDEEALRKGAASLDDEPSVSAEEAGAVDPDAEEVEAEPVDEEADSSEGMGAPLDSPLVVLLQAQLAERDEKLRNYIAAYKEATADMDRERARLEADLEKRADRSRMDLALVLVEVLDNFDRSLESGRTGGSSEDLLVGLSLVRKQFIDSLESLGVERMEVLGETFDPGEHEATGMIPATGDQGDQEIVYEERSGYRYKGRLLRPARVMVAAVPE